MQHKLSAPGVTITPKRGMGCESVSESSQLTITGVVEGEYLFIYEGKPSYKLILNSNNQRYRISGYDECKEGDTISCIRKEAEIGQDGNKKKVYWYTQSSVTETQPQPERSGKGVGA